MASSGSVTQHLLFPNSEFKVQSPYLYLQSVGSTGADGSTYGAQIRWMLLRNLGDSHLPKANYANTRVNFNKPNDYVTLVRSKYITRFPTIIDFSVPPDIVNNSHAFWIYTSTNTNTVVYIHFRDIAKYNTLSATINPTSTPLQFIQQYCPGLIEAEVKDKLFFAAEFEILRSAATILRAEALTVEENVPLSPVVVSCRRKFTNSDWCIGAQSGMRPQPINMAVAGSNSSADSQSVVPSCCGGPNKLPNGSFEFPPPVGLGFETDYHFQTSGTSGTVSVTSDASSCNPLWSGRPHAGRSFLAVGASPKKESAALRFKLEVTTKTDFCFSGWLSTLASTDVSTKLLVRFISTDGTSQSFDLTSPKSKGTWEQFSIQWNSGNSHTVTVEIISNLINHEGNAFGIDDLWFCKSKSKNDCKARIVSENIRSVRFTVDAGYPRRLEIETYQDYIAGAGWETMGNLALTKTDSIAFKRLEPIPNTVNGHWKKYNDNALVNVLNYQNRWTNQGGLKAGVDLYISKSNTDPMAMDILPGDQLHDGSIQISLLETLLMVSLDFHAACMLGLGLVDQAIASDTEEYIYLAIYDTEGALDDTNIARSVRHYYMGVPTKPLDYRLPDVPQLLPVTYGLPINNGEVNPTYLTDPQGYTPDGISRYVNLFVEPEADELSLFPFFIPPTEFCAIDKTSSVFYGIEYRKNGEGIWRTPEIAHDIQYKDLDAPQQFETIPLPNNHDALLPILRHEEQENGIHEYAGYGINWFSRASSVGNIVGTDATWIKKAQKLLPPSNFAVQLIQKENPLMLTTSMEQTMLLTLSGPDDILLRVTFDYNHVQDINYGFADQIELFFRSEMPRNVVGAVKSVIDDPLDNHKAIIHTEDYTVNSQGTTISPSLDPLLYTNFIGGVLSCLQENYIITDISTSLLLGEGPVFTVIKNVYGNASDPAGNGTYLTVQEYRAPDLALTTGQVMFMVVENMSDSNSWGTPNPLTAIVNIGDNSWMPHSETYNKDGDNVNLNLRGFVESAILEQDQTDPTIYKITFDTFTLQHHSQFFDINPVDWYKGTVRVDTIYDSSDASDVANAPKKILDVLLIDHLGDNQPLVLHVLDNAYDPNVLGNHVVTGIPVIVNYYPGYKLYLHSNAAANFTGAFILPSAGEGSRKTWLGARSHDTTEQYYSAVGIPAPIVALEFIEPLPPEEPVGGEFATWPDFFYKSSYTFKLNFQAGHKPFVVVMYRANDETILRAIYNDVTHDAVIQKLDQLGEGDPYRANRWKNLLSFDYTNSNGFFGTYPTGNPDDPEYAFPNPDVGGDLDGSAPASKLDALKEAILSAFTSLTELPLIFDFIKDSSYIPAPKRQNLRDNQGNLLLHTDPAFDMAPMAKRTGNGYEVQFTDFTLDGTGSNIFFYLGREIGNRGRMGDPGPIAGPIQLINTRPPEAPEIKKMYVQEIDLFNNTGPAVIFETNAYPIVQKVERVVIYRANNAADALSVRTMQLVKTVDFVETTQIEAMSTMIADDFEDGFIPYGDPLYYRIVAQRKVKTSDGMPSWAPSKPSKLLLTMVPDTINPTAPEITYTSNGLTGNPAILTGVVLSWPTTVYNGTYNLQKMNSIGNWVTIYRMKTNDDVVVNLAATDFGTDSLPKSSTENDTTIYNRFRVEVENSSGLFSLEDKVLTI